MDRHIEDREDLIDLGAASVETRGGGLGRRDSEDEKFPITGLADD